MSVPESVAMIAAIVTIATASLGMIGWLGRKAWHAIRRLTLFLDDYEGTPARPGIEARPGVMERLQRGESLAASTSESVARLTDAVSEQGVTLAEQKDTLAQVSLDVAQVLGELPKNGVPLAHKIDALWTKHLADLQSAAVAAAAAQATVVVQPVVQPPPALEDGASS